MKSFFWSAFGGTPLFGHVHGLAFLLMTVQPLTHEVVAMHFMSLRRLV